MSYVTKFALYFFRTRRKPPFRPLATLATCSKALTNVLSSRAPNDL